MKTTILLICIFFITALPCAAQDKIDFARYEAPVKEVNLKKIDSKNNAEAEKHKKQINKAVKNGINFAGHYILASLDCGSNCSKLFIVDALNGKVFSPNVPDKAALSTNANLPRSSFIYKPDSRLLVIKNVETGAADLFYEWTGSSLKQITQDEARGIGSRVIPTAFQPAISQMKSKTMVPILVPAEIPAPKFLPRIVILPEGSTELAFYSHVYKLTENEYELTLDIVSDCNGNPNCNYGRIKGRKNSPTVSQNNFAESGANTPEPVLLADGINGFYIPAPDDPRAVTGAQVFWTDGNGNQYLVSLRRAPKEDVVSMANSMINNFSGGK